MNVLKKRAFGFPPSPPHSPPRGFPQPQQPQPQPQPKPKPDPDPEPKPNPQIPPTPPDKASSIMSHLSVKTTVQIPPNPTSPPETDPTSTPAPPNNPNSSQNPTSGSPQIPNGGNSTNNDNDVNDGQANTNQSAAIGGTNNRGSSSSGSSPANAGGSPTLSPGTTLRSNSFIPVQTYGPATGSNTTDPSGSSGPDAQQLSSNSSKLSGGAIAALVIGCVIVLALTAAVLYRALSKRRRRNSQLKKDGDIAINTPMSFLMQPPSAQEPQSAPFAQSHSPSVVSMIQTNSPSQSQSHQSPFHDSNVPPVPYLLPGGAAVQSQGNVSSSSSSQGHEGVMTGVGSRSVVSSGPVYSLRSFPSTGGRATEGHGEEEEGEVVVGQAISPTDGNGPPEETDIDYDPFHADDAASLSSSHQPQNSTNHGHSQASPRIGGTLRLKGSDPSRYRSTASGERSKSIVSSTSIGRSSSIVDPFHADDALSARAGGEAEMLPTLHLSGSDDSRYKPIPPTPSHSRKPSTAV